MWLRKRFTPHSWRGLFVVCALTALAAAVAPLGEAQRVDHTTVLRVLRESRDPRARVRAALALGGSADRSVTPALVQALSDSSPAVRAAAATSLGRLADPSTIDALQRAQNDRAEAVRTEVRRALQRIRTTSGPDLPQQAARAPGTGMQTVIAVMPAASAVHWPVVRYVVVLGPMQNRSTFRETGLDAVLQREVTRSLVVLRGVAVFNDGQQDANAEREIRRRRLSTLRLEGSISRVDRRPSAREVSVRSEVSLILMDHPGRNLRSMLNGAATATQPARIAAARPQQERQLAEQALTGAVRSAMSGAARAIASAGRH